MTATALRDEPLLPRATRFVRDTDHPHFKLVRTVIRAGIDALASGKAARPDPASSNLTATTRWGEVWICFSHQLTVTLNARNGKRRPRFTISPLPGMNFDIQRPDEAAPALEAALVAYDRCETVDGSLADLRRDAPTSALLGQVEACYQTLEGSYPASVTFQPPGPYLFPALYISATLNREWTSSLALANRLVKVIQPSAQFALEISTPGMSSPALHEVRLTARRTSSIRLERPLEPIELLRRLRAFGEDPASALVKGY